jgi:hypothetical protein
LPIASSAATIAARASGRSGAVAFQSRYVRAWLIPLSLPRTPPLPAPPAWPGECVQHLLQRHAVEEGCDLIPQRIPQPVRQAALAREAGHGVLAPAARHADAFLHRRHDLGDGDAGGGPAQPVAAGASALAVHQPGAAQLGEQLLQVGQRYLLALGNRRQRHSTAGAILGEVGHGGDRVPAFGVQLHELQLHSGMSAEAGANHAPCIRHPGPCYDTPRQQFSADRSAQPHFRTVLNSSGYMEIPSRQVKYFAARASPVHRGRYWPCSMPSFAFTW